MLTVQTALQKLTNKQREELINTYIDTYMTDNLSSSQIKELPEELQELTVVEYLDYRQYRLEKLINRLCKLPVKTKAYDEELQPILVVTQTLDVDGMDKPEFNLFHLREILNAKTNDDLRQLDSYAYEFENQQQILGYRIAETALTKYYLIDLLADILNEATFFGYENEYLAAERQKLDDSIAEVDAGQAQTISYDELVDKIGLERSSPADLDDNATELQYRAWQASWKFNDYSKIKELRQIQSLYQN